MPRVLTLDKSLSLLESVFSSKEGSGTRALALDLGLNVATAHNIARTFCLRGYLRQDPGTKLFHPGFRLMLMGRHPVYLRSLMLSAETVVDEVASSLNESILLASIDHGHIINLKYVPSRQALRVAESDDMSDHAYATAVGKVLLASLTDEELEAYCHRLRWVRFTPHTIIGPERLRVELAGIKRRKYARTREEFSEGLSALAVPICDPWGNIVASIGASAPSLRLEKAAQFKTTLAELRQAARSIEQQWTDAARPAPVKPKPAKAPAARS